MLYSRVLNVISPSLRSPRTYHYALCSTKNQNRGDFGILGVPFCKGQPGDGVAKGPNAIRNHNLEVGLENLGWHVKDYGDLKFTHIENDHEECGMKNPKTCGLAMKKISDNVQSIVNSGRVCLALGGDHSSSIGTMQGHLKAIPEACVVWIDAHADLNTTSTSYSGNVHGMPISFVLNELANEVKGIKDNFEEWSWLEPCLPAKSISYIGLRDVDDREQEMIRRLGIHYFSMYDIEKYGISETVRHALKAVNPNLDKPIHLSYDIDALDPSHAPSTGTPVEGGLTLREGFYIAEELAATGKISVMDMVEVNPEIGGPEKGAKTAGIAKELIMRCFGQKIV